jgi:OOP family OmpA-OmpF porin
MLSYFLLSKKPAPQVAAAPQAAVITPTIAPVVAKSPELQPEIDTITAIKNAIAAGANTENRSVNFNDILFKYDSDSILTESNASLDEAYSFLNEIPKLKVKIVGHTSNEGKVKYNEKLSKKRAVAVLNYLVGKGIAEDRMVAEGKGSYEPVAENDTDENKQKNRVIYIKKVPLEVKLKSAQDRLVVIDKEILIKSDQGGRSTKYELKSNDV